jgi:DNA repair protein RadC
LFALYLPAEQAREKATLWLENHKSLLGIIKATDHLPVGELCSDEQWSDVHSLQMLQYCAELFNRSLHETLTRGTPLTSPADTLDYLQRLLQNRRREIFHCMFLDTRHRVVCHEELFQGSIDGACVYPRVVAEHALRYTPEGRFGLT